MGSGWNDWPLMIFTVFGQCVAGGFIVLALELLKGDLRAEAQQRVIACIKPDGGVRWEVDGMTGR